MLDDAELDCSGGCAPVFGAAFAGCPAFAGGAAFAGGGVFAFGGINRNCC